MTNLAPFGPPQAPPPLFGPPRANQAFGTPGFIGPPPAGTGLSPTPAASALPAFGGVMMAAGAITSAIGAFYSAKSAQYQLESQALSLEFRETMANINARNAEADAAFTLQAGRRERALSTLQYRAVKGQSRARIGARGIQAGVGSAAEEQATIQFAADADSYTIDLNSLRAAQAARRRATNFRTVADISGVSARNARRSASSIVPALAAGSSLLTGASQTAMTIGGL